MPRPKIGIDIYEAIYRDCFFLGVKTATIGLVGIACMVLNVLPDRSSESMTWATAALVFVIGVSVAHELWGSRISDHS